MLSYPQACLLGLSGVGIGITEEQLCNPFSCLVCRVYHTSARLAIEKPVGRLKRVVGAGSLCQMGETTSPPRPILGTPIPYYITKQARLLLGKSLHGCQEKDDSHKWVCVCRAPDFASFGNSKKATVRLLQVAFPMWTYHRSGGVPANPCAMA